MAPEFGGRYTHLRSLETIAEHRRSQSSRRRSKAVVGALAILLTWVMFAFATSGTRAAAAPTDQPEFLLVGATGSQAVTVFRADEGSLTKVSQAPTAAQFSLGLTEHPNHRFVYSSGVASGTIQGWAMNSRGVLMPLPGGVVRVGEPVTGMAISPDGRYMVASVGSLRTTLVTYRISETGRLSRVSATSQPHLISPLGHPLFAPDGKHVYVPSFVVGTMDAYRFSGEGGLTHIGTTEMAGLAPALGSITPNGKFLYITNEQSHNITGWRILGNGTLEPIGAPFVGLMPHGMAITGDSKNMYVPTTMGLSVKHLSIGATGALALRGETPTGLAHPPARVVLSQDEKWLYVVDVASSGGDTARVTAFHVLADGRLAPSGKPSVDTGLTFADGDTAFTMIPSR